MSDFYHLNHQLETLLVSGQNEPKGEETTSANATNKLNVGAARHLEII